MTRSVLERVKDILGAIEAARHADARFTAADLERSAGEVRLALDALLHNLFVIGEAVKALPREVLESEPDVPWRAIKGMRDVIGHGYHRVDLRVVQSTVRQDLALLEAAIERLKAAGGWES